MKLRVRVNKKTSRVELQGEEPTLTELHIQIKEILLPSYGISPDVEFTLSLNGAEPLSDAGQSLSSCGIVSGDLICVILPLSGAAPSAGNQVENQAGNQAASSSSIAVNQATSRSGAGCSSSAVAQQKQTHYASATNSNEAEPDEEVTLEEEQEVVPFPCDPMLCDEAEDGKVPLSLDLLHHHARCGNHFDSVMVVVHLLMVETGFIPQVRSDEMPSGWRGTGGSVYRLQYTHPYCEDSLTKIVAVPMGKMLAVNACLKMNEQVDKVSKLTVDPSLYVTAGSQGDDAAAETYRNLRKLSRVFKDNVAYPVIATAREAMALPPVFGLSALPPELQLRIMRLLDVHSVVALSSVSRLLHSATTDSTLWKHLYLREFHGTGLSSYDINTNWKNLYKKAYMSRKELLKRRIPLPRPMTGPFSFPFRGPFEPSPTHPYPPGIIGGEYDQRPGIPHGILPGPRYDPIGPFPGHGLTGGGLNGRRGARQLGSRPADVRRGFI